MKPQIRYARTSDGVDIAYTAIGSGPPLLVLRSFLMPDVDTEIGLESPRRAPWLDLAWSHTVVIWDHRGSGLSGPADEYALDHALLDLEAVADQAGGQRFDMLATLSPSHFAMAYAVRHPERVGRLALHNPGEPGVRCAPSPAPSCPISRSRISASMRRSSPSASSVGSAPRKPAAWSGS